MSRVNLAISTEWFMPFRGKSMQLCVAWWDDSPQDFERRPNEILISLWDKEAGLYYAPKDLMVDLTTEQIAKCLHLADILSKKLQDAKEFLCQKKRAV